MYRSPTSKKTILPSVTSRYTELVQLILTKMLYTMLKYYITEFYDISKV